MDAENPTVVQDVSSLVRRGEHLVLISDWFKESDINDSGFSEAAADALFAAIVSLNFGTQGDLFKTPMHFIGHSRGAVVNSEIIQRLGTYFKGQLPEIQMTTLDPHDQKQDSLDVQIGVMLDWSKAVLGGLAGGAVTRNPVVTGLMFRLAKGVEEAVASGEQIETISFADFADPNVVVWDQVVTFADNYYQYTADPDGLSFTPNGVSIPDAAINFDLTGAGIGGFIRDDFEIFDFGIGGPHSRVQPWYLGTIDVNSQLVDGKPVHRRVVDEGIYVEELPDFLRGLGLTRGEFNDTPWYAVDPNLIGVPVGPGRGGLVLNEGIGLGWYYSALGGGADNRPPQVLGKPVTFDNTEVPAVGSRPSVPSVFNGDFQAGTIRIKDADSSSGSIPSAQTQDGRFPLFSDEIPGWSFHGGAFPGTAGIIGGGIHNLFRQDDNYYLKLNSDAPAATHNRLFIPTTATAIEFEMQVENASSNDVLRVLFTPTGDSESVVVGELLVLGTTDGEFRTTTLPIPDTMRGGVGTITFELDNPGLTNLVIDSVVSLDDIRLVELALSVNRWWGYPEEEFDVVVKINTVREGEHKLSIDFENDSILAFEGWHLGDNAYATLDNGSERYAFEDGIGSPPTVTIPEILDPDQDHEIRIHNFVAPDRRILEEVTFELSDGIGKKSLKTLFMADRHPIESSISVSLPEGGSAQSLSLENLAATFAPTLYFNRGEKYAQPVSAEHTVVDGRITDDFGVSILDSSMIGAISNSEAVLDLPGTSPTGYQVPFDKDLSTVYASVIGNFDNPGDVFSEFAINYWFHYPYSNWKDHDGANTHEGDWEAISVFFESSSGVFSPVEVGYSQHVSLSFLELFSSEADGGQLVEWPAASVGTSPNVYVGLGGHASYFAPGVSEWIPFNDEHHFGNGVKLTLDDGGTLEADEYRLELLGRVPEVGEKKLNDENNEIEHEWLLYPGYWGQMDLPDSAAIGSSGDDGPRGPAFTNTVEDAFQDRDADRWYDPWEWSRHFDKVTLEDLIDSDETPVGNEVDRGPDGTSLAEDRWTIVVHGLAGDPYDVMTRIDVGEELFDINPIDSGNWMWRLAERLDVASGNVAVHTMGVVGAAGQAVPFDQIIHKGRIRDSFGEWQDPSVEVTDDDYHHILLFDWAEVSNYEDTLIPSSWLPGIPLTPTPDGASGDDGYAEASGDVLVALVHGVGIADRVDNLIGYSRGAVVSSETVQRLLVDEDSAASIKNVIYLDAEGGVLYDDDEFLPGKVYEPTITLPASLIA